MEHESNRKSVFKNDCKTDINAKVAFRRKMRATRESEKFIQTSWLNYVLSLTAKTKTSHRVV